MTLEEFLRAIQPNITLLAALFAFLILFIRLFWYFFSYEKTIRDENLTRVKDLLSNAQEIQIVKPLQDELERNIELGYRYASNLFYPKEYDSATKTKQHKLVPDATAQTNIAKDIKDILTELSGQSIAQKTGQDLFSFLEKRYQKTSVFISKYEKIKMYCQYTWSCCLVMAFLSAVGMVLFIAPNEMMNHFWIFSVFLTLIIGIASFAQLLSCKHELTKNWEKLQIYGDQD